MAGLRSYAQKRFVTNFWLEGDSFAMLFSQSDFFGCVVVWQLKIAHAIDKNLKRKDIRDGIYRNYLDNLKTIKVC